MKPSARRRSASGKGPVPPAEDVGRPILHCELAEILVAIDLHHQPARGDGAEEIAEASRASTFSMGGVL